MLVKVANKETKQVQIFLGSDTDWAKSIGYSEQETEKAYNGDYYIKGYAPQQSTEEQNKAIQQARQRAYEETSDNLFMEYQEALARGDLNADEKRLEWLISKDKVREDNPYILEEQETK